MLLQHLALKYNSRKSFQVVRSRQTDFLKLWFGIFYAKASFCYNAGSFTFGFRFVEPIVDEFHLLLLFFINNETTYRQF